MQFHHQYLLFVFLLAISSLLRVDIDSKSIFFILMPMAVFIVDRRKEINFRNYNFQSILMIGFLVFYTSNLMTALYNVWINYNQHLEFFTMTGGLWGAVIALGFYKTKLNSESEPNTTFSQRK
ncbi:MAG TPA: hypothetical protein PLE32_13815 [Haliscomenobacter sp.]|nr:hypothetical protein [Haliscomenobacter sp.]